MLLTISNSLVRPIDRALNGGSDTHSDTNHGTDDDQSDQSFHGIPLFLGETLQPPLFLGLGHAFLFPLPEFQIELLVCVFLSRDLFLSH